MAAPPRSRVLPRPGVFCMSQRRRGGSRALCGGLRHRDGAAGFLRLRGRLRPGRRGGRPRRDDAGRLPAGAPGEPDSVAGAVRVRPGGPGAPDRAGGPVRPAAYRLGPTHGTGGES
ncbi:TPA_asm: UL8 iORF [Human alphaherpesvirus 1]|nr:TPA_asm: UL8 iORF [Human alphaherpesvirus 1]